MKARVILAHLDIEIAGFSPGHCKDVCLQFSLVSVIRSDEFCHLSVTSVIAWSHGWNKSRRRRRRSGEI